MKLHIDHQGVKRTIEGAFNICGSEQDLRSLARQILGGLEHNKELCGGHGYGWVFILPCNPQEPTINTPPIGWKSNCES